MPIFINVSIKNYDITTCNPSYDDPDGDCWPTSSWCKPDFEED